MKTINFLFVMFITQIGFSQTPKNSWEFVKKSGQKLIFKNSKSYNTRLYNLRFITVLGDDKNPYFLVSGRPCNDCGDNESIYILGLEDIKKPISSIGRYLYPGKLRDYENNQLLSNSKMIYGKCISKNMNDFVIWIQNDRDEKGEMVKSIFIVEPTHKGLIEKKISEKDSEYKKILLSLSKNYKELKGLELSSEP